MASLEMSGREKKVRANAALAARAAVAVAGVDGEGERVEMRVGREAGVRGDGEARDRTGAEERARTERRVDGPARLARARASAGFMVVR